MVSVEDKSSNDFSQQSSDFVDWFSSAQGTRLSDKIQLSDLRGRGAGRGAIAVADLREDDELFAIPKSLVLMTTTSSIPITLLEPLDGLGSWPPLIITIIFEYLRGAASPWFPYFRVLPITFDSLMFWSNSELAELQASAVVEKVGKESAEEDWRSSIIPMMLEHHDLFPVSGETDQEKTTELIKLAHMAGSLIMAYAFDIDRDEQQNDAAEDADDDEYEEDDEAEPLKGMVPFADMLNADADRNNARLFQEDEYLVMRCTKDIKQGEEIFNDYGPLPRSELLRMYGYVTDNYAKYDVVEFSHSLLEEVAGKNQLKDNEAWLRRKRALDEIGLVDDGYSIARPPSNTSLEDILPGQIHMLLRAMCMDDSSTKMPKMNYKDSVAINEAALLSAVLTKKLSEYSTTIEQDNDILRQIQTPHSDGSDNRSTPYRLAMAIEVRRAEKEILQSLIRLCQDHIETKTSEFANSSGKRKLEDDSTSTRKTARTKH